ncbi:ATP-dependent DNA helicase [Xylanibacter muris]|uniref:AAA family ATPase n=1 Tax=Xylanibacter muris TaxID=2736290 RepID=A0ABX2AKI1_9BACT|nr:AAA family ATPase [Xylanibacter muris]NPD91610.1 AAA family ATPase [Xylanibacter muris]
MVSSELLLRIRQAFGFVPTDDQERAMEIFCSFLTVRNSHSAMILRGSAGTGKTSLAGAIVKMMLSLGQKMVLLAPTGRAAKVFSLNAGQPAYTIHRRIYRQKSMTADMSGFNLNDNLYVDTLFIVDEASMVSNMGYGDAAFGSGRLLDDLVSFVYGGRNCRMMLIGDRAQLPPVGEDESPALMDDVVAGYGLEVFSADLTEVQRQSAVSGILYNATVIRQMITHDEITRLPMIRLKGFADIAYVGGSELIEQLSASYSEIGQDETMVITRSNKRANIYNRGIRNMVLYREEELTTGDMIMIVKNNYHWADGKELPFIANGDRARVWRVRNVREIYGFRFADVTMQFPDYDDYEVTATVILDTLSSEAPALTREQNGMLFDAVMEDYGDIPLKSDRIKKLKEDGYYNAIQIKFAYAVTCHKAQGGQWAHVYLDQGYMTDDMLTPDYIHWLYTAFTRASEKLYLVNWPMTQTKD